MFDAQLKVSSCGPGLRLQADEVGPYIPPMGGGVGDFLKATRGARTKLGKTAPFTPSCGDEAVGISPPKRRTKFSLADLSTLALIGSMTTRPTSSTKLS